MAKRSEPVACCDVANRSPCAVASLSASGWQATVSAPPRSQARATCQRVARIDSLGPLLAKEVGLGHLQDLESDPLRSRGVLNHLQLSFRIAHAE